MIFMKSFSAFLDHKVSFSLRFIHECIMAYTISPKQQQFFDHKGYLILRDVLNEDEALDLGNWAQEVHDLPRTAETPWMPYEEINAAGKRVLCRTENYANFHSNFNHLLRGSKMLSILGQLAGEDMLLFKEKSKWDAKDKLTELTNMPSQLQTCWLWWIFPTY
jgi:hypothetical protein